MKHQNHPVDEIILALAEADIPEDQINWEVLREMREIVDEVLHDAV